MSDGQIGIVFVGCVLLVVFAAIYNVGYRRGQVDALTGTVKYELIEHDDGTKTWGWKGAEQ